MVSVKVDLGYVMLKKLGEISWLTAEAGWQLAECVYKQDLKMTTATSFPQN